MLRLALACLSSFGAHADEVPAMNLLQTQAVHRHQMSNNQPDCTTTTTTCGKGFVFAGKVCPEGSERVEDETLCHSGQIGDFHFETTGVSDCDHDADFPDTGCFIHGTKTIFSTCAGGPDSKEGNIGVCYETCHPKTTTTTTTGTDTPVCVISPPCDPCKVVEESVSDVNLARVTHVNLNNQGPDVGERNIRYNKAFTQTIDGKSTTVDIVFTADLGYEVDVPEQNGVSGLLGLFGQTTGTETNMTFEFQDSTTREPVRVHGMTLTYYDIDQGKRRKGKQTVTVCNPKEVFLSSATQLVKSQVGNCYSYTSSVKGKYNDHPRDPTAITSWQLSKSVTFVMGESERIDFTSKVARGTGQRNVVFAFEPSVPNGATDSTHKCS